MRPETRDVLVSALQGENSTSRGDISDQFKFSTRSLFTNMVTSPHVYLFVKCQEVQNSPRQSSETSTSSDWGTSPMKDMDQSL